MDIKRFSEWTQLEHGKFLSGLITGMRFMDNTQPPFQEEIIMKPININGKEGFGINVSEGKVDDNNIVIIDVYTRNVTENTKYGMFSVNMTWDKNRCRVYGLENGDFGTFGEELQSTIEDGRLNVIGKREDGVQFSESQILFRVKFAVIGEVTKNNPIPLRLSSTSNYNQDANTIVENYTTLLQMRQDVWGFLAGIDNVNGAIVSEKERKKSIVDDGDNVIPAPASPSMIAMGSSNTNKGDTGVVAIWTNSNVKDNIEYDEFSYTMTLDNTGHIADILGFSGANGWNIEYTFERNDSLVVVNIHGTRQGLVSGSQTVGYMTFKSNSDNYSRYLVLTNCKLVNKDKEVSVLGSDGFIYHYPPSPGGGGPLNPGGGPKWPPEGGGGRGDWGDGGGIAIETEIWSPTEQIIWISIGDSVKVPVYLKPGKNNVRVYIPYIFPDDVVEEGAIEIDSEDYLWIPAGFKITKIVSENAPAFIYPINVVDKLRGYEVFDMLLQRIEPPVNLDEVIDNIYTADLMDMKVRAVTRKYVDEIEEQSLIELFELFIQNVPKDIMFNEVEALNNVDILEMTIRDVLRKYVDNIDDISTQEYKDILIRHIGKQEENNTENLEADDNSLVFEFAKYCEVTGELDDSSRGSIIGLGVYECDKFVTLRAQANSGWQVDRWYVNNVVVSDKTFYRFKVQEDVNVLLTFKEI